MDKGTWEYYENHAEEYSSRTIKTDMSAFYPVFLEWLPKGGTILDLGCGSGRDSLYFQSQGYQVTALDGSPLMVQQAKANGVEQVICRDFLDLEGENLFDGIWACASLLHLSKKEMTVALSKIHKALKLNGTFYLSVKQGDFEGYVDDKYYVYYQIGEISKMAQQAGFSALSLSVSEDRENRKNAFWINGYFRKI